MSALCDSEPTSVAHCRGRPHRSALLPRPTRHRHQRGSASLVASITTWARLPTRRDPARRGGAAPPTTQLEAGGQPNETGADCELELWSRWLRGRAVGLGQSGGRWFATACEMFSLRDLSSISCARPSSTTARTVSTPPATAAALWMQITACRSRARIRRRRHSRCRGQS